MRLERLAPALIALALLTSGCAGFHPIRTARGFDDLAQAGGEYSATTEGKRCFRSLSGEALWFTPNTDLARAEWDEGCYYDLWLGSSGLIVRRDKRIGCRPLTGPNPCTVSEAGTDESAIIAAVCDGLDGECGARKAGVGTLTAKWLVGRLTARLGKLKSDLKELPMLRSRVDALNADLRACRAKPAPAGASASSVGFGSARQTAAGCSLLDLCVASINAKGPDHHDGCQAASRALCPGESR